METSYIYFAFSAFFNAAVSIFLGFYIWLRDRHNKINKTFAFFSFGVALWSLPYIIWPLSHTREYTLLSFQWLHIGACYVSIFYLHYVMTWLGMLPQKKWIIYLGYAVSTFFAFSIFTPYFITDMVPKFSMRYWAIPGPLYHLYLVMFFGIFLYSSYLLYRRYRIEAGIKKYQVKLILIGIVLAFLGGSTNYFLWYNINIPPYGNILASSFVILTAYAILKYKFMDFKVVSAEIFTFAFFFIFLADIFISKSWMEALFRFVLLIITIIFGTMLIRSVRNEARRREEVTALARNLEKANLRLKDLDKQKTEFLSIAAHQLRTPLSVIKGYSELIKDGAYGKVGAQTKDVLSDVEINNERLIRLVDEFLDISRIEQGRTKFVFAPADMNAVTESVAKELAGRAAEKNCRLIWRADKKLPKINMDEEKIRHVILNFVDNAIKYGGKCPITISAEAKERGITVRVRDRGIGFGKVDEASFFQKFYRGENVKGVNVNGTGLGLYVCRKFIETHGGKVWAHSPGKNKGSEFGFWIPFRA